MGTDFYFKSVIKSHLITHFMLSDRQAVQLPHRNATPVFCSGCQHEIKLLNIADGLTRNYSNKARYAGVGKGADNIHWESSYF